MDIDIAKFITAEDGYAIAFPKGSGLVSSFDAVLTEMRENGQLDAIAAKWFTENGGEKEQSLLNLNFGVLKGYGALYAERRLRDAAVRRSDLLRACACADIACAIAGKEAAPQ